MVNSVTVSAPDTGTVGVFLTVSGTVTPAADAVQLQLDRQASILPTGAWYGTQVWNGVFTGSLLPVAPGTWYVWAYDAVTGAQAVSAGVTVSSADGPIVPVPTSIVASLLGGSAAGETPDALPIAGAAADTDATLVMQSGNSLFAQPLSAIWTWIQSRLLSYLQPQVPISVAGAVQLDNSAHNQRLLLVYASGVTIAPLVASLGPGFTCDVINLSGTTVALSDITANTGASVIEAGGCARIWGITGADGTLLVYAWL